MYGNDMSKRQSFITLEKMYGILLIVTGILWWVFWYMNPLERQITSYIWVVIVGLLYIFTGGAEILLMSRPEVKPLKNAVLVIRGEKNTGFILFFLAGFAVAIWLAGLPVGEEIEGVPYVIIVGIILEGMMCVGIKFLLQRKFFCISITEDDKMGITLISGKRRKINLGDISASTVKGRRYTLKDKNGKVIYKSDILEELGVENYVVLTNYLEEKGIQTEYPGDSGDRSRYAKYVNGVWVWEKEDNTWQNRNIEKIRGGIYLLSGIVGAVVILSFFLMDKENLSGRLLIATIMPVLLWGFIYIFALDVLYCGPLPKNVDYKWSKFHMGFPRITLFANLAALGIYLFLSRNTIVTIDTFKLFIISLCIHMVVFFLFFRRTKREMRTFNNLFFMLFWTAVIVYPLVHSVCYATGQRIEDYEIKLLEREVKAVKDADDRYFLTVEFEDGKQKKIEVSVYTYYREYLKDVFYTEVTEGFAGIRFMDY